MKVPDELSPEDRERLVKTKFRELFDECFKDTFGEAFDNRVKEAYSASNKPAPQQQQQQQQQPARATKYSLLDKALGIG